MYIMELELTKLSNDALLGKIEALAETERFSLIDLLIHLGELDQRTACQNWGYPSVFVFLTRRLGYSESDAMRRIRTARAARKYPSILRMLAAGELHLVSVSLLEPLLTSENHERLLRQASRRSTRDVQRLVADISPATAEPRDQIRQLPPPCAAAPSPPDAPHLESPFLDLELVPPSDPVAEATLTDKRVAFSFTADAQVQSWFEQARDLLRHRFPIGRMEEVFGEALRRLVTQELFAKPSRRKKKKPTSPGARHIPKWVQDEVWQRDAGRCSYTGPDGVRCGATAWLEYDHIIPGALGGRSDDASNIRLLCRAHNKSEAQRLGLWKGPKTA